MATYYYWLAAELRNYGYYSNAYSNTTTEGTFDPSDINNVNWGWSGGGYTYALNSLHGYFDRNRSFSGNMADSYASVFQSVADNVIKLRNLSGASKINLYYKARYTASTPQVGNLSSQSIVGYIPIVLSTTTHTSLETWITLWGQSYTSESACVKDYNQVCSGIGITNTNNFVRENEISVKVVYDGQPIQGVKVAIDNQTTIFPQLEGSKPKTLYTGTDGFICLSTSSNTSTTVTGTLQRKGFFNGATQGFTATFNTPLVVNATTGETDAETVAARTYNSINHSLTSSMIPAVNSDYYTNLNPYLLLSGNTRQMAPCIINDSGGFLTEKKYKILTFNNTKAIRPGYKYEFNDPEIGKIQEPTYYCSAVSINSSTKDFASIDNFKSVNTYGLHLPTLTNSQNSDVDVNIYGNNTLIKTVSVPANSSADTTVIFTMNYTGTLTLKVSTNSMVQQDAINLLNGWYHYQYYMTSPIK